MTAAYAPLGHEGGAPLSRSRTRSLVLLAVAGLILAFSFLTGVVTSPPAVTAGAKPFLDALGLRGSRCGIDPSILRSYGRHAIRLSRVHEGSGWRVKRVLAKLEQGERIKVAVVGGSVSTGHGDLNGRPYTYRAVNETYDKVLMGWINSTYGEQSFISGAMPATGASFFSFCWTATTRLEELAPDLVLVELNVNDPPFGDEARRASAWLTRSILQLPNKPAIIFVGVFSLKPNFDDGVGLVHGGDYRMPIADYYDIPQISLRAPYLPPLLRNKTLVKPYFGVDPIHIAQPLHKAMGDFLIAYLQEQRCTMLEEQRSGEADMFPSEGLLLDALIPGEVPSHTLDQEIMKAYPSNPAAPPVCHLANQTLTPLTPAHNWTVLSYQFEKTSLKTAGPGPTIAFGIEVREGSAGEIGVGYLRSSKDAYKLGMLKCRVAEQEKVLDGYWTSKASIFDVGIIATNVKPGTYRIDCVTLVGELPERNEFRIAAVMSR
ncbi:hypothetical protein JCM10296v2_007256 [Rhodotorula toruloides]